MTKRKTVPIDESAVKLGEWFKKRPEWLQDAARRLLANGSVNATDVAELTLLCKKEAGSKDEGLAELAAQPIPQQSFNVSETPVAIRLDSISEIKGINNLGPRKPLEFGTQPLTIIYGLSGSGKSGYMRILKRICGGKGIKQPLHGNVFEESSAEKSCKIVFTTGGTKKGLVWTPETGTHSELSAASLYDTDSAHVYVNEENEVTYEPPLLKLFRLLVEVCEKVDSSLASEIGAEVSLKPVMDSGLLTTTAGDWFDKISSDTLAAETALRCAWNDELEQQLVDLGQRLAESNPAEKAAAIRKTKSHLQQLTTLLTAIRDEHSDQSFERYLEAKQDAEKKRQTATVDARKVFENSPLEGVGSESWRLLWEQARRYSEKEAYKAQPFPNVGDDSRCPLCQQELEPDARSRFSSFESFVKGNLELAARKAEKSRDEFFLKYAGIPTTDDLSSKLDLAGLTDPTVRHAIERYCQSMRKRREEFLTASAVTSLNQIQDAATLETLPGIAYKLEEQAKAFEEDAKKGQREELNKKVNELKAQKWLSQEKSAIETEIKRLQKVALLKEAQRLTHTRALSEKKAEMADELVTEAFRQRFQEELKRLGASRLKVTLEKTETHKGHVFYQIKLKDAKQPAKTGEILSEGEFRIVSIAAFLADVEGKGADAPFVFDDPISSLDQPFEEATAERLVSLSKTRQVIVFTHRLSMLALLEDAAKKERIEPHTISVRSESWGAGEPDEIPIWAKRPESVISSLLGGRLAPAKKLFAEQGRASYEPVAKGICSDIRIAVERMVEVHLLNEVVLRFRRAIQTQGRLENLAKITAEDCKLIDAFMTKYSRFEHSQSNEVPVPPPDPDEIERDLNEIKCWFDEFKKRPVPTAASNQSARANSQAA